jgi:hypothetical protein
MYVLECPAGSRGWGRPPCPAPAALAAEPERPVAEPERPVVEPEGLAELVQPAVLERLAEPVAAPVQAVAAA